MLQLIYHLSKDDQGTVLEGFNSVKQAMKEGDAIITHGYHGQAFYRVEPDDDYVVLAKGWITDAGTIKHEKN